MRVSGLLETSALYKKFMEEREEILKHKWIESEKAGQDIGFEKALLSWVCYHREKWRNKN
ncbi:MAG: DUF4032 domain-containing protein [Betaproteobacteria bacterium]|jgi:hypothetical protein|nr:DUF4032 domain-containing protein [Betaproteobacteria bacterium]